MTFMLAALLGVLQGLTEFLPVSSSGHLALAQMAIPGFHQPGVVFDAMIHLGTASAVVWFERHDILRWVRTMEGRRLLRLMVLATLATALLAFPLRRPAIGAFERVALVGACLALTGCVVAATRLLSGGTIGPEKITWKQAAMVGLAQGVAVFPGISRSGITIAAGLATGLERTWAARFSFVLSVPAILGATAVELISRRHELATISASFWLFCLLGTATAALAGWIALRIVIHSIGSRSFYRFAWYCIPLGLAIMAWGFGGK